MSSEKKTQKKKQAAVRNMDRVHTNVLKGSRRMKSRIMLFIYQMLSPSHISVIISGSVSV